MKLGDLEFHIFSAGQLLLDGGAIFGVIPRPLWEKKMAPDARNRITLAMNCLLIESAGKRILVETGVGDKMKDAKFREIYGLEGPHLINVLRHYGVSPEDIDIVIDTHLHFDHCGGNTVLVNDKIVPAFPNARYIVQRGEYERVLQPTERERSTYFPENCEPLEAAGVLTLLDGDTVVAPGVECIVVPGHTANMQCVKLTGGGKTAFLFADLVPTTAHLPLQWIMGYDLYPMTTLANKKKWIPESVREGWIALFAHDAATPAAHLRQRGETWVPEPVRVD